jgi:hypothetical protein
MLTLTVFLGLLVTGSIRGLYKVAVYSPVELVQFLPRIASLAVAVRLATSSSGLRPEGTRM